MSDTQTTIQQMKERMKRFLKERDWEKHHTPKNVAMSIAIEAGELMEHFQWDDYSKQDKKEIESEFADIIAYCLSFASVCNIDVADAFEAKMKHNEKKYPVSIFSKGKDTAEDYRNAKKIHKALIE